MNFTRMELTSPTALDLSFTPSAPVVLLCGRHSALILDLMREVMGDYGARKDPNRVDDGRFVLHADLEMDGKRYALCYLRSVEFIGDDRIAVNFKQGGADYSFDDTEEYLSKIAKWGENGGNVFDLTKCATDCVLSESDRLLAGFKVFLSGLPKEDARPLFVYDFFDRIDEAVDPSPYFEALAGIGRQAFVAFCGDDPLKRGNSGAVQIVRTKGKDL